MYVMQMNDLITLISVYLVKGQKGLLETVWATSKNDIKELLKEKIEKFLKLSWNVFPHATRLFMHLKLRTWQHFIINFK